MVINLGESTRQVQACCGGFSTHTPNFQIFNSNSSVTYKDALETEFKRMIGPYPYLDSVPPVFSCKVSMPSSQ